MSTSDDQADQDHPPSGSKRARLHIEVSGGPDGMERDIRDAARRAIRSQAYTQGTLEIAIVGDTEMRRQHEMWMRLDTPTDVLSFDLRDDVDAVPQAQQSLQSLQPTSRKTRRTDPGRSVDGQLIVCKSVARRRARARGSDWRAELLLYVVHGCLHLCGHDDHDPDAAAKMHEQEDRILTALGWGAVFAGKTGKRRKVFHPSKRNQPAGGRP